MIAAGATTATTAMVPSVQAQSAFHSVGGVSISTNAQGCTFHIHFHRHQQ